MSPKVLIFVLILIGSECVSLESSEKKASASAKRQEADEEIKNIMFGVTPQIKECLNASMNGEPINITGIYTKNDKSLWTVVIFQEDDFLNIQQCSGSLIHPQVVLTAAHCIFEKSTTNLKIRAGECIKRPDVFHKERQIESYVFQDGYDPINPKRDIALIYLKEPFEINDYIKTICLPPPDVQLDANYVQCFLSGWKRQHPAAQGYTKFRKYKTSVIPRVQCEQVLRLTSLGEHFKLHKSFMCTAGEAHVNSLGPIGGAPLACQLCGTTGQMIQVGVSSWGFRSLTLPEIFATISYSRVWIEKELKKKGFQLPGCGIE